MFIPTTRGFLVEIDDKSNLNFLKKKDRARTDGIFRDDLTLKKSEKYDAEIRGEEAGSPEYQKQLLEYINGISPYMQLFQDGKWGEARSALGSDGQHVWEMHRLNLSNNRAIFISSRVPVYPFFSSITLCKMQAIISTGPGQAALVHDRPLPSLRDGYLLVKTQAVALNPTDWKHIEVTQKPGILFGCDYAGVVEKLGPGVPSHFQIGDRVAGFVHGGNSQEPEDGAFAEYIVAKADIQIHIPEKMSFEEAATLGVGITSVGQGLYQTLQLPFPLSVGEGQGGKEGRGHEKQPILIYGASTASGVLGIQFARLSGFAPLAVCSPDHFDMAAKLGAVAVFDYADGEEAVDEIQDYIQSMGTPLLKAWDTVSIPSSARFCGDVLSAGDGCHYASLLPMGCPRPDVTSSTTMAYTVFGEDWGMGATNFSANTTDAEFGRQWWALVQDLLDRGCIQTHRIIIGEGGLEGVLGGLQQLRDSRVRGGKLVFRI